MQRLNNIGRTPVQVNLIEYFNGFNTMLDKSGSIDYIFYALDIQAGVGTLPRFKVDKPQEILMILPIAFHQWKKTLSDAYGSDAVMCVDPMLSTQQIEAIVSAARSANPDTDDGKKAIAAYNNLWVMDLTGEVVVLARKMNWGFFALVMDHIPYTQPVTVEEPDPRNPLMNKSGVVGKIQALIAVSPNGCVFVKTVEVSRPVATGVGGAKLLKLDRTSTSRGAKLEGTVVGTPSYINSARLRGSVQCLSAQAPEDSITDPGWMPVEEFFRTSPDIPGKAALITALVNAGLVDFNRA